VQALEVVHAVGVRPARVVRAEVAGVAAVLGPPVAVDGEPEADVPEAAPGVAGLVGARAIPADDAAGPLVGGVVGLAREDALGPLVSRALVVAVAPGPPRGF